MSAEMQTTYAVINSGSTLSDPIGYKNVHLAGLIASVSSCQVYIQVSHDVTSANFARAGKLDGSGDWVWAIGSGHKAVGLDNVARAFPYARIETDPALTDTGSFALVFK